MKKILISFVLIVASILIITSPTQAAKLSLEKQTAILKNAPNFHELTEYSEYSRIWLSLCPKLVEKRDQKDNFGVSDIREIHHNMTKENVDLALKICTKDQQKEIEKFLDYLLSINVYGSCDLRHGNEKYSLPGAVCTPKIQSSNFSGDKLTGFKEITLFNPNVSTLFPKNLGSGVDLEGNPFVKIYDDGDIYRLSRTTIINACKLDRDNGAFQICNNIVNISDPSRNQSIFSPYNMSAVNLQQMHFNMIDNAEIISSGLYDITFQKELTTQFREEFLNPTILFGRSYDFKFKQIGLDNELEKAKIHLVPGGLGWLIDLIADLTTKAAEGAYSVLANWFLSIKIEVFSNQAVKQVWSNFRNIANIIFVIFFLLIILSQLTGWGLSSYSIKKMLPKLITAVILVNLSFYISQAAIDLSNIIGKAIFDLLVQSTQLEAGFVNEYSKYQSTVGTIGNILNILLLIIAGVLVLVATLINIMLLAVRDAVVVLVLVLSPIALVSGIFNNSRRLFNTWSKTLLNIMSIFPIISSLIGGALLVDKIIMGDENTGPALFLTAKLALFGAMIMIPFIVFKMMRKISSVFTIGGVGPFGKVLAPISDSPMNTFKSGQKLYANSRFGQFTANRRKQQSLSKLAGRTGKFWSRGSSQAQHQLSKQRQANSELFTQQEASQLINMISGDSEVNISQDVLNKYNFIKNNVGIKETALSLALAQAKDIQGQQQTSAGLILSALTVAAKNGASQSELKNITESTLKELDQKRDFRSVGLLKANLAYNQGQYGKFNQSLLAQADKASHLVDPNNTEAQALHNLIKTHTQSALREYGLVNGQKTGVINSLNAQNIERGSTANQVFIEEINASVANRDSLISNYHLIQADAQQILGADIDLINQITDSLQTPHQPDKFNNYSDRINNLRKQYSRDFEQYRQEFIDNYQAEFNKPADLTAAENYASNKTNSLARTIESQENILAELLSSQQPDNFEEIIDLTDSDVSSYQTPHEQTETLKQQVMESIRFNNGLK